MLRLTLSCGAPATESFPVHGRSALRFLAVDVIAGTRRLVTGADRC